MSEKTRRVIQEVREKLKEERVNAIIVIMDEDPEGVIKGMEVTSSMCPKCRTTILKEILVKDMLDISFGAANNSTDCGNHNYDQNTTITNKNNETDEDTQSWP